MSEVQKPEKVSSKQTLKTSKAVKRKQEDKLVRDKLPNKVFASELEELKSFRNIIYLNLGNMVKNHPYKIISAEKVNTKFGDRILLELEGNQRLNLPEKYNKLSDNVIAGLNKGKYHLINYGQVGKSYSIDFSELQEQQQLPQVTENEQQQPIQSETDQQYSTETEDNVNYDEYSQQFDISLPGFYNVI